MKRFLLLFRHGEYDPQKFGDGPLTAHGIAVVTAKASYMLDQILRTTKHSVEYVDTIVSGSLRGLHTYHLIALRATPCTDTCVWLNTPLIHTNFFTTPDESAALRALRQAPAFVADEKIDPDGAMLKHGLDIFRGPTDRVVKAIREKTTSRVVLDVTHAIVDMLTIEALTGVRPPKPLDYGCFKIVEFE